MRSDRMSALLCDARGKNHCWKISMRKMIAVCGIDCAGCPAYLATINDDKELRTRTAAEWKDRKSVV